MGTGYRAFDVGSRFAGFGATRAYAYLGRIDAAGGPIRHFVGEAYHER